MTAEEAEAAAAALPDITPRSSSPQPTSPESMNPTHTDSVVNNGPPKRPLPTPSTETQCQPVKNGPRFVQATHDFIGTESDELDFFKGDKFEVLETDSSGWWIGYNNGRSAWFPSNFVIEVDSNM